MLYNTQDMLLRRKLEEQADLQHAIELQSRRLMNLQLLDVKKHHQRNLSSGSAIPSPTYSHPVINQSLSLSSDRSSLEVPEENCKSSTTVISSTADNDKQLQQAVNVAQEPTGKDNNGSGKEENNSHGHGDFQESVDHNLPDSPFASPTRSTGEHLSIFSGTSGDADRCITISATSSSSTNNSLISPPLLPATSTLDMASLKACFFPIPRKIETSYVGRRGHVSIE